MDYLEAKINQLVVESAGKPNTFIRTFTTKPSKPLLNNYGKIFGLIEIANTDEQIPELIDLIIDEIKNNYYHPTPNKYQQLDSFSLSDLFEDALKKTNLVITSFLETKQISVDLKKINIIIALIHNQDLFFTAVGDIAAILIHNVTRENYRIINIFEVAQYPLTSAEPIKFFSQVVSGRLKPRDILFISSSNILDYFSLERIKNYLIATVSQEGISELKNALEKITSKENFGALAVDLDRLPAPVKKPVNIEKFDYQRAASQDSIKDLIRTERETEKLLTPSLLPELKKYAGSLKTAFANYLEKARTSTTNFYQKNKVVIKPNLNLPKPNLNIPRPQINLGIGKKINHLNKISGATSLAAIKLVKPIYQIVKNFFRIVAHHAFWIRISAAAKNINARLLKKYNTLPASSKILLVITIIFAILFFQSIIWLAIKNNREQKLEAFNEIIFEAENKKNEAQASLIYRDENLARNLLIEARTMLTSTKPLTNSQKEQTENLTTEIEAELQKLRHLIEITDPTQIVNFQNLDQQAVLANVMSISGNVAYTQNLNNKALYKANLDSRVMSAIVTPDINVGNFIFTTQISQNEIVLFDESLAVFRLTPTNDALTALTINITDDSNVVGVTSYNNRLYLLDEASDQIYRYNKTTTGFGGVSSWLRQTGLDLAGAKSLTIDGAIYIIKNNGEIIKLINGQVEDFKIKTIDPALESPTKIKTADSSNYLYILDPPTKRLIVLDKEGNLINQYSSEVFTDLKDFMVMENTKTIYILNGTSIFGFPAWHLQ